MSHILKNYQLYIYESLINTELEDLSTVLDYILKEQKLIKFTTMMMNSILSDFQKELVINSWKSSQVCL